ncbi:MAG: ABC transporter ATP-binding protein [Lachnospiraceae bacterium]|nr:ABC transporter ATP-binding protein [Lachnospiraceae bacterium]
MSTENAISVNNLTKRYEGFQLDNISFQIPSGTIVGFVGENGAGKSTTIRAILGLTPIENGEIEMLGHQIGCNEQDGTWREQIGVVFDECNLPASLKVRDIRHIMKNIYKTWDDDKFTVYMTRFKVPFGKKIKDLSKGMKMKLSIAVAFAHDSRLLILDEATSGLDPIIRSEILDIFREFIEDEQHTIFLSSHVTSDIEKIADYVMLIHKGKLLFTENKDELLYNYGIVRCSKTQAALIPKELIVGKEENAFETSVLVRDVRGMKESDFWRAAERKGENSFVVDRANIEDILLYIVKAEEKR